MKENWLWKKLLSLFLVFSMVVTLIPASLIKVQAADTLLASAIFASDVHEESTSLTGSGTSAMKSVMSAIASNNTGKTYNTIGFVGDTYTDIKGTMANMTSAAQSAIGNTSTEVYYAWGDHDEESDIADDNENESSLLYSGSHYYIYHLSDKNMRSNAGATDTNVESAISNFETAVASMDKSKVLFIMSHAPLHARRGDNAYADDWYIAITAVAKTMDVVVFWAHNHTQENSVQPGSTSTSSTADTDAYYVAKYDSTKTDNETMVVQGISEAVSPNFTYMNAGYIYAAGQNPKRKGVATTVDIYADKMMFQDYNSSGKYTDSSYSHNVTVAREFASTSSGGTDTETTTITSIAVTTTPTKTTYSKGESFDKTGMIVTATYSDGTTKEITDYTVSTVDTSSVGTKTVTVTYEGLSTTFEITVTDDSTDTETNQGDGTVEYTITTSTSEQKEVYVLVSSISTAGDYLIANTNSATTSANLLTASSNGVTNTSGVTVVKDGDVTYIESATSAAIWTASKNGSGYRLISGTNRYLRYNKGLTTTSKSSDATTWYSETNTLYKTDSTRYVRYSSGWSADSSTSNVYFYQKQTINIGADTTITGTVSLEAGAKKEITVYADDVTYSTVTLDTPILNITTDEGTTDITSTLNEKGGTYTYEVISDSSNIINTNSNNGTFTLNNVAGTATVKVIYTWTENNTTYTVWDTVEITTTLGKYITPSDGDANFPEYPNEGSIRFDKTASAVGNFSQTGIAQVELSMTGVPFTTNNAMDVVVMLDMTGSMSDNGMEAAEEATKAFVAKIVKNTDGTYNSNRVAVYAFNSGNSSPYELVSLDTIDDDTELTTANTAIDTASDKQTQGGTPYDKAAKKCYDVLQAAKTDGVGNNRKQFCVYMSDGGPTTYYGVDEKTYYGGNNNSGDVLLTSCMTGYSSSTSSDWSFTLPKEYYTEAMKADGVTVYTVGLMLQTAPENPAPYSSMTDSTYDSTTDSLTTIGSHYYFCSSILKQMASDETKYIDIFNVDNASNATAKFSAIAESILEAATDVVVTDKISDRYTMIFDIPEGTVNIEDDIPEESQEFYIEVVSYALDSDNERTTETSLIRIYIDSNGAYYYDGNTKTYYAAYDPSSNSEGVTVSGSGETLTIECKYFSYNAATRILQWKAEKLSKNELALRYFLYLDNSATEVGTENEVTAATYPTNDYAYLTYTNYKNNKCKQYFPVPKMTWNGAQVTYVFYLVNSEGQPVNKTGTVVDFANATFVTSPVTESVVWNEMSDEETKSFNVTVVADDILPEIYQIYDSNATYEIHVFEDETGDISGTNYFTIGGTPSVTSEIKSLTTTKVYNTKAGVKYSNQGTYYSTDENLSNFDFANTTVAFAVTWTPALVEDTIVVDYGLPVNIHVLSNDLVNAVLNGLSSDVSKYGNNTINTQLITESFTENSTEITLNNNDLVKIDGDTIRYEQNDMSFNEYSTFYYDAKVTYYEDGNPQEGYLYSKVNVIPATTIYYEDDFLTYAASGTVWEDDGTAVEGATQAEDRPGQYSLNDSNNVYGYDDVNLDMTMFSLGTAKKVHVDADSYATASFTFYGTGFDVIGMTSNTTGTLAIKVTAAENIVVNGETKYAAGAKVKAVIVNTYYGYKYENGEWIATPDTTNALYQVPVMQIEKLPYGKYNVVITATYADAYNLTNSDGYDLYLDAIRIYDPANDGANDSTGTIENAYKADGEGWPSYIELRNKLITSDTLGNADTDTEVEGLVFIDGDVEVGDDQLSDYVSYGPNNEIYLAPGQRVAFLLDTPSNIDKVHIGIKSADGNKGTYTITNIAQNSNSNTDVETGDYYSPVTSTINTTTDMYYDLTKWKNDIIVISNTGNRSENNTTGVISITNIKSTYTSDPNATTATSEDSEDISNETTIYMTPAAATLTLRTLNYVEPTPFVPETLTIDSVDTVELGDDVTVNVTTSTDVISIDVNDKIVDTYTDDETTGLRTFTTIIPTTTVGELPINVVAYNDEGTASEVVTTSVNVIEKSFKPETFEVSVIDTTVIGLKVKVTVNTSTDVEYVSVNDGVISSYRTNRLTGLKTFTTYLTTEEVGELLVEVVAYDNEAIASDTITEIVTVKDVKSIIEDIFGWLFR